MSALAEELLERVVPFWAWQLLEVLEVSLAPSGPDAVFYLHGSPWEYQLGIVLAHVYLLPRWAQKPLLGFSISEQALVVWERLTPLKECLGRLRGP